MGKCKKCGIQLPGRLRVCSQHRAPKNKRGGSRPGPEAVAAWAADALAAVKCSRDPVSRRASAAAIPCGWF
jgi:hypothetical protein